MINQEEGEGEGVRRSSDARREGTRESSSSTVPKEGTVLSDAALWVHHMDMYREGRRTPEKARCVSSTASGQAEGSPLREEGKEKRRRKVTPEEVHEKKGTEGSNSRRLPPPEEHFRSLEENDTAPSWGKFDVLLKCLSAISLHAWVNIMCTLVLHYFIRIPYRNLNT